MPASVELGHDTGRHGYLDETFSPDSALAKMSMMNVMMNRYNEYNDE